MTVSGFDTLFLTLAFVVPGFILYSTYSIFVPRKHEQAKLLFLRLLTLSCINYAVWSWLIYLIFRSEYFTTSTTKSAIAWFIIIFISPCIIGVISGPLSHNDFLRKIMQKRQSLLRQ